MGLRLVSLTHSYSWHNNPQCDAQLVRTVTEAVTGPDQRHINVRLKTVVPVACYKLFMFANP